jgi:hypothetical protein
MARKPGMWKRSPGCAYLKIAVVGRSNLARPSGRFVTAALSRPLYQARDGHQNYRADESHNQRPNYATSGANSQQSENPPAENASENAENNVYKNAVTAAFHQLTGKPAGDQTNYDPFKEVHVRCILLQFQR